ncbi:MAG: malto-oligosyltrehalose synthase [Candidatus Sumerlaeia bacterium]
MAAIDNQLQAWLEGEAARTGAPRATYRCQFTRDFTFENAVGVMDYLADLGVSHLYASPLLRAGADSTHGYDIVDHNTVNPNLGGEAGFERLSQALRAAGLGLILDIVPNHMGIADPANGWWQDVLENGPASIVARNFDINWRPVDRALENKIVLPILEDQYGKVLEMGKFRLSREGGAFVIHYYGFRLPVAQHTCAPILSLKLDDLRRELGEESEPVTELLSILTAIGHLPPPTELPADRIAERLREKEIVKRRIAALADSCEPFRAALDESIEAFNGVPGRLETFNQMDGLIEGQSWRPAFWRVAGEEINFRRFFEINTLAAVRVELAEVFEDTHGLILKFIADGKVDGLRIDHPDGLWDPAQYLRRLQTYALAAKYRTEHPDSCRNGNGETLRHDIADWLDARGASRAEGRGEPWPLYVVVEKILGQDEPLPLDWMTEGTTGYDFARVADGLAIDGTNRRAFDRIYGHFTGRQLWFHEIVNDSKRAIMALSFAGELGALAMQLQAIARRNRRTRDFTLGGLRFALREIIAALPIYRTYVTTRKPEISPRDRAYLEAAIGEARRRNPRIPAAIPDFVGDTLLLRNLQDFPPALHREMIEFLAKFQQIAGPVMAKGFEDTALYIYNRLVSLNDVGGRPDRFGVSREEFHAHNADRRRCWPLTMLAGSTHDAKRSEDVRARISVLSEMAGPWRAALGRWSHRNAPRKMIIEGQAAPDRNDEYLLYQTLVGAWPPDSPGSEGFARFRARILAYMQKAVKEAKVHTSWISANEAYDKALARFIERLLDDTRRNPVIQDIASFARHVAYFGRFNSLAQVLLRLASPGVPDIYQGTEMWDLSLVDPDNRRPVDFGTRRGELARLRRGIQAGDLAALADELVGTIENGAIKLYVIVRALDLRRENEALFAQGGYEPVAAGGDLERHVVAFARRHGDDALIAVAPRLVATLTRGQERPPIGEGVWDDTWLRLDPALAGNAWRNIYTGETLIPVDRGGTASLPMPAVLSHFPVAILVKQA